MMSVIILAAEVLAYSAEGAVQTPTATTSGTLFGLDPATIAVFGALIGGIISGIVGLRKGDEAKKLQPPDSPYALAAATIIEKSAIAELTAAVAKGVDAIEDNTAAILALAASNPHISDALKAATASSERRAKETTEAMLKGLTEKMDVILEASSHKPARSPRA